MPNRTSQSLPPAPPRPLSAHKGDFGTVIILGGSRTMIGAPALAASAALRAGAGLVKIAALPSVLPFALTIQPSATGIRLDPTSPAKSIRALNAADPDRRAILAVGPGLGPSPWAQSLVITLINSDSRPLVLDADALNALATSRRPLKRPRSAGPLILTPHPGEFARLAARFRITESPTDPRTRPDAARKLALAASAIVLLKGRHTVITDARRSFINSTGNPALATAGSGDILTGLLAALLAQHTPPLDAARLAAHLHGLAADLWARRHAPVGLTASDLAALLPDAFAAHRRKSK